MTREKRASVRKRVEAETAVRMAMKKNSQTKKNRSYFHEARRRLQELRKYVAKEDRLDTINRIIETLDKCHE